MQRADVNFATLLVAPFRPAFPIVFAALPPGR